MHILKKGLYASGILAFMDNLPEVANISEDYGDKRIVNALSFNLRKGSIGCLLGESGCGKTTLLR